LFEKDPTGKGMQPKGNRDVVEGKYFVGRRDSIISSGEDGKTLQPYLIEHSDTFN
jgi:hypothetical protein